MGVIPIVIVPPDALWLKNFAAASRRIYAGSRIGAHVVRLSGMTVLR